MGRTVDDYDSMAKREMIKAKQEKAMMYVSSCIVSLKLIPGDFLLRLWFAVCRAICLRRVQKFRADYADLRGQFEMIKNEVRTLRIHLLHVFS